MISKQQYQSAVRGENYPVVFGVINQDSFTVHSARGLRNQSHGDFPAFRSLIRDNISWRYVPSTEFIYWWEVPTAQEEQAVREHLLKKYNYQVKGKIMVNSIVTNTDPKDFGAMALASHDLSTLKSADIKMPTFKQYMQGHGYTKFGDSVNK